MKPNGGHIVKKHSLFPGIILIGIGSYFLLQQLKFSVFDGFFSWQTLVMIIWIALLVSAYSNQDHSNILPGVILTGFGIHFHPFNQFAIWPKHFGMLILIIAVGLILRSMKTKTQYSQGVMLLVISILLLKYDEFLSWMTSLGAGFSFVIRFWPILLIAAGFYLLFIKKK